MSKPKNEWDKLESSVDKGPTGFTLMVGFKIILVVCILGGAIFAIRMVATPATLIEKTLDADNILYNYEYFKNQFRAVEAIEAKIVTHEAEVAQFKEDAGPRTDWTFEDKNESSRISSIVTGLKDQRNDMIADYNAKANMVNRKIFMGDDCPAHIQP
jgi:hypothetical protein